MTTTTKLQIPITRDLKALLMKRIAQLGFTSLNEAIRFFLTQIAHGNVSLELVDLSVKSVDENTKKRI